MTSAYENMYERMQSVTVCAIVIITNKASVVAIKKTHFPTSEIDFTVLITFKVIIFPSY
jgi:hypothetical protein